MMRTQYGVNVRVINNSWGGGEYSAAMDTAIRAAGDAGILFVAAAGNSATNNDTSPQYPASYTDSNVISVAAVDQNKNLASFSCYGATTVDIAAPGVSIYSTVPGNRYAIYSGTSMATPFVSGVAALAWAADPNATVAEVRNAILNGADKVAALTGKVASGGVLDAYHTLQLLGVQSQQGPVVGSLVASPGSVNFGAAVALRAGGIADSSGAVTNVSFVLDANNNGQYDAADTVLGSTSSIASGQASITVDTSGWAAGSYRILARAEDSAGVWSSCVSTTLTVLPADDYGNSAATAAAIGVPSSTAGAIETGGDVDWFKFQAVAGKAYVFTVGLGTLPDSVLVSLRHQRRQAVGLQRRLWIEQRLANRVDRAGDRRLLPRGGRLRQRHGNVYAERSRGKTRPRCSPPSATRRCRIPRRRSPSPCTPPTPTATV